MISPALFLIGGLGNGLYHWAGKYPKTQVEIRQSWTWCMGITLALSILGLIISHWLAPLIKVASFDLRLFLFYCPFGLASLFMEDLMIARGDIWKGSLYGSGFQVFRAGAALAAAYWGRRVEYVLWVFFGVSVLRAWIGWLLLHKSGDITPIFSRHQASKVLRYAFPVSIAALTGVALQNVDQLILSFRLHPAEFAFYAMGCLSIPPPFSLRDVRQSGHDPKTL